MRWLNRQPIFFWLSRSINDLSVIDLCWISSLFWDNHITKYYWPYEQIHKKCFEFASFMRQSSQQHATELVAAFIHPKSVTRGERFVVRFHLLFSKIQRKNTRHMWVSISWKSNNKIRGRMLTLQLGSVPSLIRITLSVVWLTKLLIISFRFVLLVLEIL